MFQVRSARIALRCWRSGDGETMAKIWEKRATRNFPEPGSVNYNFRKKPLGGFDRREPESSLHPRATEAQYTVQVNFGIEPRRAVSEADYDRHEHLKIATPAAFAAETGSETVFHCQHPTLHYQMKPKCLAVFRSPDLQWGLAIYMAPPKEPKHMTVEDLRADVTEAYALVAAHIIPARK